MDKVGSVPEGKGLKAKEWIARFNDIDLAKVESICRILLLVSLIGGVVLLSVWTPGRYSIVYSDGSPFYILDTSTGDIYRRGKVKQRFSFSGLLFTEPQRPAETTAPAPARAPSPDPFADIFNRK
jgi:hypothetical protein